jgi:RNA polymerase sigma-70 factor (ECF subfamily)
MNNNEAVPREAVVGRITGSESPSSGNRSGQFDGLVRNHYPELMRHVYRRVRSWAEADDIVQETYTNLAGARTSRTINNIRAYLFKMAGNLAHDWNRKRLVRNTFAREELLRVPTVAPSAEDICEGREQLECLLRQIDNLPQQCRIALMLVRHEGLSIDEAAAHLGIKPKSVRALISRAMKYLLATVPLESFTTRGKP